MKAPPRHRWTVLLAVTCFLLPTALAADPVGAPPGAFGVDDGTLLAGSSGTLAPAVTELAATDPARVVDAFVTFHADATPEDAHALTHHDITILRDYGELGFAYVTGEAAALARLATVDAVRFVTLNEDLEYYASTGLLASRVRGAWDDRSTSTTPVLDANGRVVDGRGIGVAVIDSGVDATHPDLAPATVLNQKFVCTTPALVNAQTGMCAGGYLAGFVTNPNGDVCDTVGWVEAANTDASSGHGTHVAGTVLGRGVASDGRFMGAAPGASLYAFSTGEGINVLSAVEALAWVWCNHADVTPAIRIVTNSWGNSGAFDAADPVNVLVDRLVEEGVVVLFAAGNDGGDGSENTVSGFARNPTPGVISVANYDDGNVGTREGAINPSSSRGAVTDAHPEDWPDVAAPGTAIVAPRAYPGPVTAALGNPLSDDGRVACCVIVNTQQESLRHQPYYVGATGTSMATPQVAGIAALLLQRNPDLSPADVEDILEDTATAVPDTGAYVTDSGNPTTPTNHAAGHGLVDALAALQDARVGGSAGSTVPPVTGTPAVGARTPVATVNPQASAHVQWVSVTDATVDLGFRDVLTGDATAFPVAAGQDARFRLESPTGAITFVTAPLVHADTGPRMSAQATLDAPGTWRVEPQVDFGNGHLAVDAFHVNVV